MDSSKLVALLAVSIFACPLIGKAQTGMTIARPGLYKGSITVSSDAIGEESAPVRSKGPVVARVKASESLSDKLSVVIRAKPELNVDRPLREFGLVFNLFQPVGYRLV